ncbi:D-serine deaminase-like pyridoxal phosphate-dependent protein [Bradyrhizobium sp. USDA 4472]
MKIRIILAVATFVILHTPEAIAGCYCSCIDGQMQPVCSNSYDVAPVCPATTCARSTTPRLTPPPLAGSRSTCRDQQVCDAFQRCEWKVICKNDR